jgi:uncharacterized protein YacL
MHTDLQTSLRQALGHGAHPNAAANTLLNDYARYHLVLVVMGGFVAAALIILGVWFLLRLRRPRESALHRSTLERRVYGSFGAFFVVIGLLMSVIVAANATNVMDPQRGLIGSVGTPPAGTPASKRYQTFNTWVRSGRPTVPAAIQSEVNARLSWQRPKAIVCSILLVGAIGMSAFLWKSVIKRSRRKRTNLGVQGAALLAFGIAGVFISLLLVVMVLANTQASLAPVTMTLVFG